MINKINRRQKTMLLLFFLAFVFFFCFNQINNADSFYHIRAGQLIWQTGHIPHSDVFSYSAAGAPWIPHEWLAELIFFGIQNVFSFWGLMTFIAALAAITFFLIFLIAREHGANFFLTLIVLSTIGAASFQFWVPRPQSFVFFFCILLIYLLEKYRINSDKKYLWWTAFIILIWANMNASVILGIIIIALFSAGIGARERNWSRAFKHIIWTLFGATALCFVNPSTYHIFTYGTMILPALRAFGVYEWQPILTYWAGADTKLFVGEIVAAALFLTWHLGIRRESRNYVWLGLVIGVSIMPFIASRYLPYWALFAAAPLAWTLSNTLKNSAVTTEPKKTFTILLLVYGGLLILRIIALPTEYTDRAALPVYAAEFLAENGAQGNTFNAYDQGGYLLWRLWPDIKISMDGRSETYLGRPTDEYFAMLGGGNPAKALIQKYDIQYFVFPYDPTFLAGAQPLLSLLSDNGWQMVWWDDGAIIFAMNDIQNKDLIKKYAIRYAGPFIDPSTITGAAVHPAVAEIQSLMERAPGSTAIANYAKDFLTAHGGKSGGLNL